MLNVQGQGFEVFKLLIGAVIAVAILYILLTILGGVKWPGNDDPQNEASKLVNSLSSKPAQVGTSDKVVFTQGIGVNNRAVAKAGQLSDEQVCVLLGEFENDARFQYTAGEAVVYKSSDPQNAQITAVCDTGGSIAANSEYFQKYTGGGIDDSWVSDCGCINDNFNQKCCIVALKKYVG